MLMCCQSQQQPLMALVCAQAQVLVHEELRAPVGMRRDKYTNNTVWSALISGYWATSGQRKPLSWPGEEGNATRTLKDEGILLERQKGITEEPAKQKSQAEKETKPAWVFFVIF